MDRSLKVLIVRLGAMGDILHALPGVTALRAAHPEWEIGWAVEPQWRALLASGEAVAQGASAGALRLSEEQPVRDRAMPLVDRIHMVAAKQWARKPLSLSTLSEILRVRREIRRAGYDIAVDLQGAVRSAMIGRWAAPKTLIGEAEPREPIARWWFNRRVVTTGVHVIEQAVEVAQAVAGDALPVGLPALPVDAAAGLWADAHAPADPFVLVSPGAGWGAKRWPLDRYVSLAKSLEARGWRVVVNASPAERADGEQLARESGALLLVPTLAQLIALTRRAALAVAGDTGPLHLASALGLAVVGIFGPTDPARNGPFHGRFVVLRHPESKRDHTRHAETEAGLLEIAPGQVLEAALELLAEPGSDAAALDADVLRPDPAQAPAAGLAQAPAATHFLEGL